MATSVMDFANWTLDLEARCEKLVGIKTADEPTDVHPKDLTQECIRCHGKPDYILIRLSFCFGYTSIRYGICKACHRTDASEQRIEDEMEQAHRRGERDNKTPEQFQCLIDEAMRQVPSW